MSKNITMKRRNFWALQFTLLLAWPMGLFTVIFAVDEATRDVAKKQAEVDMVTAADLRKEGLYRGAVEAYSRAVMSGELAPSQCATFSYEIAVLLMDELGLHLQALEWFDRAASFEYTARPGLEERRAKCRWHILVAYLVGERNVVAVQNLRQEEE